MSYLRPSDMVAVRPRLLRVFTLLIVGAFLLCNLITMVEVHAVQAKERLLIDKMLASVQLVSEIVRAVDRKRLYVDAHIFEKRGEAMADTERKIARIDAALAARAQKYEAIAMLPGEREAWQRLQQELAVTQPAIDKALALSRENRDLEAHAQMIPVESHFAAISQAANDLTHTNRDEIDRVVRRIRGEQRLALLLLGAITFGGTLFVVLTSEWMLRLLGQRDESIRLSALELEQRNRDLDAFAGRVAHDLRGPLTAIGLAATGLAERAPQERGAIGVLQRGVTRLESLIQDLLALSRVGAQAPGALSQARKVIGAVEEDLRPTVAKIGGRLELDVEPATVGCSEGLLRQVLWNLGENAVKYRRPDVPLELRIQGRDRGNGRYQFRVSDNGPGMSPAEANQAFEAFYRGEQARGSIPGTGLGLSIVKRVIEASRGTVALETTLGSGTTVIVTLPVAAGDRQG
jgi:signal transduction histidine kinase